MHSPASAIQTPPTRLTGLCLHYEKDSRRYLTANVTKDINTQLS